MGPLAKIVGALRDVARHPLNRRRKLKAVLEYGFIQVAARLIPGDVCLEFPNHTRLLVSPRMKGAAHYIAPRLCEFEEMAFVAHFLRPGQLFADVGANVGAFTILAAGVAGARAVAFEASPDTFETLVRNIRINGLEGRVTTFHAAAGRDEGAVQFSIGLGTENYVARGTTAGVSVTVKMTTLDKQLAETPPDLLKVDVEGFETEVFAGGSKTLRHSGLQAIIIERNNMGARYGFDEAPLHQEIQACGFVPCRYDPFTRCLSSMVDSSRQNIIYTRDIAAANAKLQAAPAFKLDDLSV